MEDSPEKSRQEILRTFSEEIRKPLSEVYFSEEDLAMIFDIANEMGDYYLMNEALLVGARLYPDSSVMTERRGLYYIHEEDGGETLRRHLQHNPETGGVLTDILSLNARKGLTPEEAAKELDIILRSAETFEDEDVVQYCETAFNLGCFDFLVKNIDALRAKTPFLPTLLYEMASWAEDDGQYELAMTYANELIEDEPYNAGYWDLLGRIAEEADNIDKAREAADMAIAIDPADEEAVVLKLKCAVALHYVSKADADFAEEALKKFPDSVSVTPAALGVLLGYGRNSRAAQLASAFFRRHPENAGAVSFLLENSYYSEARILKEYLNAHAGDPGNRETVGKWIDDLMIGHVGRALEVWETYEKITRDTESHFPDAYFPALYHCHRFEKIFSLLSDPDNFSRIKRITPDIIWYQIHSMLILGHECEAKMLLRNCFDEWPVADAHGTERLAQIAVKKIAAEVIEMSKKASRKGEKVNWLRYNPLAIEGWSDWYDCEGPDDLKEI